MKSFLKPAAVLFWLVCLLQICFAQDNTGDSVVLSLVSGAEYRGVLKEYADGTFVIQLADGRLEHISHDKVRSVTFAHSENAQKDPPKEDSEQPLSNENRRGVPPVPVPYQDWEKLRKELQRAQGKDLRDILRRSWVRQGSHKAKRVAQISLEVAKDSPKGRKERALRLVAATILIGVRDLDEAREVLNALIEDYPENSKEARAQLNYIETKASTVLDYSPKTLKDHGITIRLGHDRIKPPTLETIKRVVSQFPEGRGRPERIINVVALIAANAANFENEDIDLSYRNPRSPNARDLKQFKIRFKLGEQDLHNVRPQALRREVMAYKGTCPPLEDIQTFVALVMIRARRHHGQEFQLAPPQEH